MPRIKDFFGKEKDNVVYEKCISCKEDLINAICEALLNPKLCMYCETHMKYLDNDIVASKVKFIRKIRCDQCSFRVCNINNINTCLWCIGCDVPYFDNKRFNWVFQYGKYKYKSYAYVLQNDFDYCKFMMKCRQESQIAILTKIIIDKQLKYIDIH
jgi:hypothetical protein